MTFLIVLDGAEEAEGRLPPALMPRFSRFTENAACKGAEFFLPGRPVDSLSCIMSMLGVPEGKIPPCRAPVEALGAGIEVPAGGSVFRCNVAAELGGRLASFNGGGLSREELRDFSAEAARLAPAGFSLRHLSDYRNLLSAPIQFCPEVPPPHESVGKPIEALLSGLSADVRLSRFVDSSRKIRQGFLLYPWGAGAAASPVTDSAIDGRCAFVCGAEVVSGIAKLLGAKAYAPPGATGDADTDLAAKAKAALRLAARFDTVVVHVNGTDELAHRRDLAGKAAFLEKIDRFLLAPILDGAGRGTRVIVTSDHVTSSVSGCHERLPVRWWCADFEAAGRAVAPPAAEGGREGFHRLLKGE